MEQLLKKVRGIIERNQKRKWMKAGIMSIACLVVFVTTYSLILPAITISLDRADEEPGFEVASSQGELLLEEGGQDGTDHTGQSDGNAYGTSNGSGETGEVFTGDEDASSLFGSNDDEAIFSGENEVAGPFTYTYADEETMWEISAELLEGELLPADTVLTAEILKEDPEKEEDIYPLINESYHQALTESGYEAVSDPEYYQLTFERNGEKLVTEEHPVPMRITFRFYDQAPDAEVTIATGESVSNGKEARLQQTILIPEEMGYTLIADVESGADVIGVAKVRKAEIEETDGAAAEESASEDTTEGITEEAAEDAAEDITEGAAESVAEDAIEEPETEGSESAVENAEEGITESVTEAESEEETESVTEDVNSELITPLIYEGEDYTIQLTYGADAEIPEDAFLKVREIGKDSEEYQKYLAASGAALESEGKANGPDANTIEARFFDITIMSGEQEVEPKGAVSVDISYHKALPVAQDGEVNAVHFENGAEEATVLEATPQVEDGEVSSVSFDTESFSVFGIVYTVDFEYSVNGKMYQFSLPGGGFVSFTDLVEVLGIIGDTNSDEYGDENGSEIAENTEENAVNEGAEENGVNSDTKTLLTLGDVEVSEATRNFVADVASVEFSSPSLVDVSKVENETTVGQIKENRGLECEYSEDLTEEQIAEINAQAVEAGDWALISVHPFMSEESLTVTMKNGEVFTIRVTDEQENNPLGLGGQTFVICNYKNNTYSALTASESNGNGNCLSSTNIGNVQTAPDNIKWTFEYTGTGTEFLIHDQNNRYLMILDSKVELVTNKDTALQNPIVVTYDNSKDRYSFKAKNSNQALNNYGNSGFGRWDYDTSNNDFWMQLRNPDQVGKPGLIATADTRSEGIVINLFDYGPDSLDLEGNTRDNVTNEGINSGHILKFFSHGTEGTDLNSYTGTASGYRAMQGIVQPELSGGYPVLTGYTTANGGSLQYLFDPSMTNVNGKTVYPDVNHLFTKDENGYYSYDSNMNYAYYNTSGSNTNRDFAVYANSYNEEGTVSNEKVGFFPFNDYDSYYNCIHGGEPNDETGFGYYGPHWKGAPTYQHYGLDKLGHYNHHFGLSMTADFVMTKDGTYNGRDMEFSFSGDDDMWVFVDGVLVLDIGGIHNPVSGSINFRTGQVTVSGKITVDSTGALAGPTSLQEAFSRVTGKEWDDSAFSSHKLQVFYMERGGMYSNCQIGFNLPTYKTLSLSKKLNGLTETEKAKYKDETFIYEVFVNDELYNGNDTIRFNAAGEVIEEGFQINNGQVTIKDGETVVITGLHRTDTFYAAEEYSLNMEQFEVPHAERDYIDTNGTAHEEEITLTGSHTVGAAETVNDWKTPTYNLQDTEKVTFHNTLKEKDLEVEKVWRDDKDHSADPISFKVDATAYAQGEEPVTYLVDALKKNADSTANDKTFVLNADNGWKTTIEHLPMVTPANDSGKRIIYSVNETDSPEGYTSSVSEIDSDKWNIDAIKFWPDHEENRNEVIHVRLKNKSGQYYAGLDANGNAIFNNTGAVYDLTPDNGYTYRFHHVPVSEEEDPYVLEEINDQNTNTTGLVMYKREIINIRIINTPSHETDPDLPGADVENHKRIDALRDGKSNPDTDLDEKEGEDLTDLYRLYLDFKINSVQEANGVDLLFVIDHSGSMNNMAYGGNPNRAPSVMNALNGENGIVAEFLKLNDRNQWAAVGFKGPAGNYYWTWGCIPNYTPGPWTGYRQENAGQYDSEILSAAQKEGAYTFGRQAAEIQLPNEGENMLTDYTAGLWQAEQFLLQDAVKEDGRKKVVVFISDGIPTLYIPCENTLANAGTTTGSYYYPDWSGGCPDETLVQFNNFVNDIKNNQYVFGDNIEFYTIGFGDSMQAEAGQNLLKSMLQAAYGKAMDSTNFMTVADSNQASAKLMDDLRKIVGSSDIYKGVIIQDDLSRYVDLYDIANTKDKGTSEILKAAGAKVTMTDPSDPEKNIILYENGALVSANNKTAENVQILNSVTYDAVSKTVKAIFNPEYTALPGITYTLSFDVRTTQTAYDVYEVSGYDKESGEGGELQVIQGDPDTDYLGTDPVNSTSSGREGFRSNDEAVVQYDHNGEVEYTPYSHPVIQVFNAPIQMLKTDQFGKPLVGATFSLYKNEYDASGTTEAEAANAANLVKGNLQSTLKGEAPKQVAEISVENLKPGTYYLVETATPAGYNSIEPIKIVVSVNTTVKDGLTSDSVNVTATQSGKPLTNFLVKPDEDNHNWVLKVQNTSGYELPSTGGPGTRLFSILGSILILGAGVLLWRRRRMI